MAWAKVDDGWWCHPKVMGLSLPARGLWVSALSWSCHQRLDEVPARFLAMVGADEDTADELVAAGLWHDVGDGYRIHDWAEYQDMSLSEKRADAGRKGGEKSGETRRSKQTVEANPKQTTKQTKQTDEANSEAGPSLPIPSQPNPTQTDRPGSADADPSPPDGAADPDEPDLKSDPTVIADLCDHLATRIEAHRGGDRPAITTAWRRDMDLLLRRGPTGVTPTKPVEPDHLRRSIDVVFDRLATHDRNGFCWADQIRSPGALRSKWPQLRQAAKASTAATGAIDPDDLLARATELRARRQRREPNALVDALEAR